MNTIVRGATIILVEELMTDAPNQVAIPDQIVEVRRPRVQAVAGMDGHMSNWDELVTILWEGSHLAQVEAVGHVEIRDSGRRLVESLPMFRDRRPYEKDGDTVFFLSDAE